MGYKPKVGDLVQISSKWHPGKTLIGVVTKINKSREHNGTINVKLVFDDDREANYIIMSDVKLLSRSP